MDSDHLTGRAIETALLEAVTTGKPLSAKQLGERKTAALARWRGHTKSMPNLLRPTAAPGEMAVRVKDALDQLFDEKNPVGTRQKAKAARKLADAGPVMRHVPEEDLRDLSILAGDHDDNASARKIADHVGMEQFLSQGGVYGLEKLGGRKSQSSVFAGKVDGLDVLVKPAKGFGDRGNNAGTPYQSVRSGSDAENERAGFIVAQRLGLPVAHTVVRDVPGEGKSIVQERIGGESVGGVEWYRHNKPTDEDLGRRMRSTAVADAVMGNLDRHLDQFRVGSDGTFYPVDHGIAFPDRPARTGKDLLNRDWDHRDEFDPDVEFANTNAMDLNEGKPLTERELATLRTMRADPAFARQLKESGISAKAIERTMQRLDALIKHKQLPEKAKHFIYDPEDPEAWEVRE